MIQNVAKVCRMIPNLLGSSWSNLFTLEAACPEVRTVRPTKLEYEYELNTNFVSGLRARLWHDSERGQGL